MTKRELEAEVVRLQKLLEQVNHDNRQHWNRYRRAIKLRSKVAEFIADASIYLEPDRKAAGRKASARRSSPRNKVTLVNSGVVVPFRVSGEQL